MENTSALLKSFHKLSDDISDLLDDNINTRDDCDVIIKVGKDVFDENTFRAHSLILRSRSEYFKAALSTTWSKKNSDGLYVVNLSGMNIHLFGEILFYIYGGYVYAQGLEVTEKLQLLIAADVLMLDQLIDFLEEDLIYRERDYINKYTSEVLLTIVQIPRCKALLKICEKEMLIRPKNLLYSKEFLSMPRNYLISLLKRNILGLFEINIWNQVINWGIHNTPECESLDRANMLNWTMEQVEALKANICELLPLIRFFKMDPKCFIKQVEPYKQIFEQDLYDEIINYHEKSLGFEPTYEILPLRFNSTILDESHLKSVASWIDLPEEKRKDHYSEFMRANSKVNFEEIPYEFHLLYRCHGKKLNRTEWCKYVYNQGPTLTIVKAKNKSDIEILGGYKSISWSEENKEKEIGGDGFIFYYYERNEHIRLQWITRHFPFDMYLGGSSNSYDFREGKKMYVFDRSWLYEEDRMYLVDIVEVFKVVKKEIL